MAGRPNILLVLTDQQRYPPSCERDDLRQVRREVLERGREPQRGRPDTGLRLTIDDDVVDGAEFI